MTQLDIFAVAARKAKQGRVEMPPFQHAVETSRKAAVAIRSKSATLRERVLLVIANQGAYGCTDGEGCERSEINPSTWRPRRIELLEQGRIRDSGRTRATASGRQSTVWVAAGAGDDDSVP